MERKGSKISGCWENLSAKQVLAYVIHCDQTTIAWSFGLRNLQIPGQLVGFAGMPFDHSRNEAAAMCLRDGYQWLFSIDSVPDYTPILIKRNGSVECIPICDVAKFIGTEKEYIRFDSEDIQVFVGERRGGWTPIRHVLRHPFDGDLYRINTHAGVVDVSANHSIIRAGGPQIAIKGENVRVGMQLSMPYERGRFGKEKRFFFGTPELAWFYGFFAAEGCASVGNNVHVDNNNVQFLERCNEIMRTFFGRNLTIHVGSTSDREIETKRIATSGRRIFEFFRTKFYNSLGQKKVPIEILNAPANIKRQFLQGYCDGDGHPLGQGAFAFSTNSPTLALGIQWLLQTATQQTYSVQTRLDKLNIVDMTVNIEDSQTKRAHGQRQPRGLVKKVHTVPYRGYLYDIETDSHVFAGGVGPILLHNSDVIPPHDAILKLISRGHPFISGLYARRSPPHAVPVAIKNGTWLTDYRPGSIVEVDLVGAGCLAIHRSVLERVPPQRPEAGKIWFDWRVDMKSFAINNVTPDKPPLSEDFTLCDAARRCGFKIMLDTSVVCRHVGLAQSTPGNFVPLETTPNT